MTNSSFFAKYMHLFVFAFLSCLVAFSAQINLPVTDTFHVGEYVGFLWHMREYYNGLTTFPLFIHGGMDYIPSIVASFLFGDEAVIIGTRVIIVTITAFVYFLFMDICYSLINKEKGDIFWCLVLTFIFYYFTPPLRSSSLSIGFLPVREAFLFLTIWCFVKQETSGSRIGSVLFLVLGAFSTVISVFWCYNRGVMAFVFAGFFVAGLAFRKKAISLAIVACSALLCLAVLEATKIFGGTAENIDNIRYWFEHAAEITRYSFDVAHLPGYIGLLFLSLFSISVMVAVSRAKSDIVKDNIQFMFIILGLIMVQLLLIKSVFDRADLDRSFYGGWPSIFIMFYFGSRLLTIRTDLAMLKPRAVNYFATTSERKIVIAFGVSISALVAYMVLSSPTIALSYPGFIKYAIIKTPDVELVSKDIVELGDFLRRENIRCYFNWTNEGVIPLIAKNDLCTEYPYVHYVSKDHERDMLVQLQAANPQAIVYDTASWSVAVDHKHMSERFPLVNSYIQENYQSKIAFGSYLVALKGR